MAEFLTTQDISDKLGQIIMNANGWLILVSPYLSISENLLASLQDADRRKVKITLIYGKKELKPQEKEKLNDLSNASVRYLENLHAKCFLNDSKMIITSMNLYEFSEKTNREMGILVTKDEDSQVYHAALEEVRSICQASRDDTKAAKTRHKEYAIAESRSQSGLAATGKAVLSFAAKLADFVALSTKGYCIRCRRRIELDTKRPYCSECYKAWAVSKNRCCVEYHCHLCGGRNDSTITRPRCWACYEKQHRN